MKFQKYIQQQKSSLSSYFTINNIDAFQQIGEFMNQIKNSNLNSFEAIKSDELKQFCQSIIIFMSQPLSADHILYPQTLNFLNHIFNTKPNCLNQYNFPIFFYTNLSIYFINLCHYWHLTPNKDLHLKIYSILYLIVRLIYHNIRNETKQNISKQLFCEKMLNFFFDMKIPIKVDKFIGIIVLFLSKNIKIETWYHQIKLFVFNSLQIITSHHFYYLYTLRQVKNYIQLKQIQQSGLLEIIINYLNNNIQTDHLAYILQLLYNILNKHHILRQKITNLSILNIILQSFQNYHTLAIIKLISKFLSLSVKIELVQLILPKLIQIYPQNNNSTSINTNVLYIINMLSEGFTNKQMLNFIYHNQLSIFIEYLNHMINIHEEKIMLEFISILLYKLYHYNYQLMLYIINGYIRAINPQFMHNENIKILNSILDRYRNFNFFLK